jgi:hypothetical protein
VIARPAAEPVEVIYVCTGCALRWAYSDVRFVACCPACGGGLVRDAEPGRIEEPPAAA